MTKDEAKKVIIAVQSVYPAMEISAVLVGVWYGVLRRWPYEAVHAAVLAYLSEPHDFAPRPGDINERCIRLTKRIDHRPSAASAFQTICQYARGSVPHGYVEHEFRDNPAALAALRAVTYDRIRFANIETELKFVQRDFERNYDDAIEREVTGERLTALPPLSLKVLPEGVSKLLEAKL